MKPATELIHGDGASRDAEPLTTPIYETTTFLFENAGGSAGVQRGEVDEVPLLALREPDRARGRAEDRRARGSRVGAAVRRAARRRRPRRCWRCCGRRRSRLQRRDLRRHAAPARRSAPEVRHHGTLRDDRRAARPETIFSDATKLVWFESPINPDPPPLRRHRRSDGRDIRHTRASDSPGDSNQTSFVAGEKIVSGLAS